MEKIILSKEKEKTIRIVLKSKKPFFLYFSVCPFAKKKIPILFLLAKTTFSSIFPTLDATYNKEIESLQKLSKDFSLYSFFKSHRVILFSRMKAAKRKKNNQIHNLYGCVRDTEEVKAPLLKF